MAYDPDLRAEALRRLHVGEFPVEIAAALGVTDSSVTYWARRAGIVLSKSEGLKRSYETKRRLHHRTRTYTLNEAAFEGDLTPGTAWVLGHIFGNGYICTQGEKWTGFQVCGDLDICQKIALVIGSDVEAKAIKGCYEVRFFSDRLVESLTRYGLHPAKTYDMRWPDLPAAFVKHFVRGFWEADGTVTSRKSNGSVLPVLSATSCSEAFMRPLHGIVRVVAKSQANLFSCQPKKGHRFHMSSFVGNPAVRLGDWLWKDVPVDIRGDRKYARLQEVRRHYG